MGASDHKDAMRLEKLCHVCDDAAFAPLEQGAFAYVNGIWIEAPHGIHLL